MLLSVTVLLPEVCKALSQCRAVGTRGQIQLPLASGVVPLTSVAAGSADPSSALPTQISLCVYITSPTTETESLQRWDMAVGTAHSNSTQKYRSSSAE